ncbi:hypothetical protein SAM23877_5886 [Streptomyces ambofaciens ATCC 23877]|uniref:Uncharacterized protein n=1 Tax=Streptomyces ambofaciens (strain ATCC 23877 / 3486 / DSM 40053 / JCM 4204 / NBRC 12836 / NRRL B-2516) TaxID=278992 RepID=A0A0K2B1A2_STRA7|nr:hypothetical protein SAM23877_5886 [Streptomyces ambofaciens ATCC 23877]
MTTTPALAPTAEHCSCCGLCVEWVLLAEQSAGRLLGPVRFEHLNVPCRPVAGQARIESANPPCVKSRYPVGARTSGT